MAINPEEIDVTTVDKLDDLNLALGNFFAHTNLNGKLGKATLDKLATFLAPYITAVGGSGFVATTGTVLPAASAGKFTIVGPGTYTQTTGGNVVTTELFNILGSSATTWSLVKAIPLPNTIALKTDVQYKGTFDSLALAIAGVPLAQRKLGDTVGIKENGSVVEYWWKSSTDNDRLELKQEDLTGKIGDIFGENAYSFLDANNKLLAKIDKDGLFDFEPSADLKNKVNNLKEDSEDNNVFTILDKNDRIVFSIDEDGNQFPKNGGSASVNFSELFSNQYPDKDFEIEWSVKQINTINPKISLPTIAVGRETSVGANDAPTIPITTNGLCHPSVVYIPSGWNGWKYWMAFTPTFGVIPGNQYENPHIMVSQDGIVFQEPIGISNPIDLPPASPSNGYWSDTHLKLGSDGYMHLWYRGNALAVDGVTYGRVVVHKKSRDGVIWSKKRVVFSTNDPELKDGNLIVSPAFVEIGSHWHCWDGLRPAVGGIEPVGNSVNNSTAMFAMRRTSKSPDEGFEPYAVDKVVNFVNRPWGVDSDMWHLDVQKYGNTYFMLCAVGSVGDSGAGRLYLGYSGDGWNFKIISTPIMNGSAYRSCMVFKESAPDEVVIETYIGKTGLGTSGGEMELKQIILNKA